MGCSRLELCRVSGEVLYGFPQFLQKNAGVSPKQDCNRLFPDHFQFIIHKCHIVSPKMSKLCQPFSRIYKQKPQKTNCKQTLTLRLLMSYIYIYIYMTLVA